MTIWISTRSGYMCLPDPQPIDRAKLLSPTENAKAMLSYVQARYGNK